MPFVKGDTNINRNGRPKEAKSTLPLLRDKLFALALRRMKKDPELQDVDNTTLIKFIAANLPRDMSLSVNRDPSFSYISQVPRPELTNEYVPIKIEPSTTAVNGIIDVSVDVANGCVNVAS